MIHDILVLEARQFALACQVLFPPDHVLPFWGGYLGDNISSQDKENEENAGKLSGSEEQEAPGHLKTKMELVEVEQLPGGEVAFQNCNYNEVDSEDDDTI